jgi:hypothetical protein
MRVIDVVLASFAVGAAAGLLPSAHGSAGPGSADGPALGAAAPAEKGSQPLSGRLIWLRTPAMRRAAGPR